MYHGSLCDVNISPPNPVYKRMSRDRNYKRGLIYHRFKEDEVFLNDALLIAREIKEIKDMPSDSTIRKKDVLTIQLRAAISKLIPKWVIQPTIKKDAVEQLEEAIRLFKAIKVKDTMNLRIAYFNALCMALPALNI